MYRFFYQVGQLGGSDYGRLISAIRLDLLDVLGDDYISQHVQQCMTQELRERLYRQYITDALYCVSKGDQAMARRWSELDPGWDTPKPTPESAEAIVSRLKEKINGEEDEEE